MDEIYLFIVWNKALFCLNKILSNLSKSFEIEKHFFVKWDEDEFYDNIVSLYGTKATDVEDKIKAIGEGKFCVIIVKDRKPLYELRKTYMGMENINSNIYDKKWLYRKWTAGQFRIHSTQTQKETIHDLTILFGPYYQNILNKINNNDYIHNSIFGRKGYNSLNEFCSTIKNIDNNYLCINEAQILIFSPCELDLKLFFKNETNIKINNSIYEVLVLGEAEGNLPKGFINKISNELIMDFNSIKDDYLLFISNRNKLSNNLINFYQKYNFEYNVNLINTMRKHNKSGYLKKIKYRIKYLYCRFFYFTFLLNQKD